jgi:hypothetical protein
MGFDSFDRDDYHAEKLQTAFRGFVQSFLDEDASPVCRELLNTKTAQFRGGNVVQKPEEFTQRTIIEAVLKALGHEVQHHPVALVPEDRKQPDIKLRGTSDRYVGIVECKALNRERNGEEALDSLEERYLKTNAFSTYKKSMEMEYLVGIATDGFDWKIRVKELETGRRVPEYSGDYSLVDDSDGIHHCYYSEVHEESKTIWPPIREELAQRFVSKFGKHNLPGES